MESSPNIDDILMIFFGDDHAIHSLINFRNDGVFYVTTKY
ncbi:hypothetical protein SPLC1_S533060 [Arthrospira platensis C1]|nr:hypothetical protein SPLC1_S533060 [Arthrospira platensis C1]